MEKLRIKEIAKSKGMTLDEVSKKLGITYSSFFRRIDNPKYSSLKEIANALNCEVHELIGTSEKYAHFYDDKTGEWLGVRKK